VISLGYNHIGAEGVAAVEAGLHGMPLLEYVMQAWVMCMVGRGQAGWCDGSVCKVVCAARPVSVCLMCEEGGDVRGSSVVWVVDDATMWLGWCVVGGWTCGGVWVYVVCEHVWVDVHVRCGRCRDAV
jgi:hypothetical protein